MGIELSKEPESGSKKPEVGVCASLQRSRSLARGDRPGKELMHGCNTHPVQLLRTFHAPLEFGNTYGAT